MFLNLKLSTGRGQFQDPKITKIIRNYSLIVRELHQTTKHVQLKHLKLNTFYLER